jgi:hypothetical protein
LSRSKGYNTHFFKGKIRVESFEESTAWVGIQEQLFLIVEPTTGRIMRTILFSSISEWGRINNQLCLKVATVGEFHIESAQIDVLTSVYQTYTNYHSKLLNSI